MVPGTAGCHALPNDLVDSSTREARFTHQRDRGADGKIFRAKVHSDQAIYLGDPALTHRRRANGSAPRRLTTALLAETVFAWAARHDARRWNVHTDVKPPSSPHQAEVESHKAEPTIDRNQDRLIRLCKHGRGLRPQNA